MTTPAPSEVVPGGAPLLSPTDIAGEVQTILRKQRRSRLIALFGRGESGNVQTREGSFEVIPTRCELELRDRLPAPGALGGGGRVYLVDWTDAPLPLDIACRLAGGRMFRLARDTRLASLFGARQVESGLVGTRLATFLLSGDAPSGLGRISGQVLTRSEAYRRCLRALFGLPLAGDLRLETLVAWGLRNHDGPGLGARAREDDLWSGLRAELRAFVAGEADGDEGRLGEALWIAWEQDCVARFVEVCALVEAVRASGGAPTYAEGLLEGQLATLAPGFGALVWESRATLADARLLDGVLGAIAELDADRARSLLDGADALVSADAIRAALGGSPRLRAGHTARKSALGEALSAAAKSPTRATLRGVCVAAQAIAAHGYDRYETPRAREVRMTGARLAAWLVHRAAEPGDEAPGATFQAALDLADRYRSEGGWVDAARRMVRGAPGSDALATGLKRVLKAVDARRAADDEAFAAGYAAWLAAGRPATQALPIGRALRSLGADFLAGSDQRRLLVVLVDGMSWAEAVQVVGSLAEHQDRWGLAAWRPTGFARLPAGTLPPVLAAAPTETSVSRSAFFSGKDAPAGKKAPVTTEDPARFAGHAALAKVAEEPRLFLQSDWLGTKGIRPEAREAIESEARIVGVVLNTIDDQLKGGTYLNVSLAADDLTGLPELMIHAAGAGRAVLLASDHGHVPGAAMTSRGKVAPNGGRRWRPLKDGTAPETFEVVVSDGGWRPPGSAAVAMIWDERACYGQPAYGAHGGASLAEVVAPALLLAPEGLEERGDGTTDDGLRLLKLPRPAWWHLEGPPATPTEEAVAAPPGTQLGLLAGQPEKAPDTKPAFVMRLAASKDFREHARGLPERRVRDALDRLSLLMAAGDTMAAARFSDETGLAPHRIAGAVAQMGLVLNSDGYAVVEYDERGKLVRVDRAVLAQLYGVEP